MFGESFGEAWRLRYGTESLFEGEAADRLGRFLTHRSVRSYSDLEISRETLAGLIAVAQSAATSSNLQLWSVVSVQDSERRTAIARLSGDQKQVHEAPWFLAFCVDLHRLERAAEAVGENPAALDTAEFYTMAVVDAALAAERLVVAAESIGISSCYIGALRNDVYGVQDLLSLPSRCFGVFGLCLGYPADDVVAEIKPRLGQESVWFEETYDSDRGIGDYDTRMVDFYVSQGMNPGANWSMRSGRRVNGEQMTGRD
ncbi:MAG: NADPH-dependent oxidoreductase, partial [Fimbriimonadaceae bacterium]